MALHCFGDSYTEGYKNDMKFPPYEEYRKSLGVDNPQDMPPIWSEILGKKLGMESVNHGKGGASNHETLLRICEQSKNFKKGDIVIINWTYVQRCLWDADTNLNDMNKYNHPYNNLTSVTPHQGEHYDPNNLYKKTYDIIAINRLTFSWTYEVLRYQEIIDTLSTAMGFDVYYWFTDNYLFNNLKKIEDVNQPKYIIHDLIRNWDSNILKGDRELACIPFNIFREYGAKTISEDSKKDVDEMHLGGTGHKVQANIFYSYITKKPYPKKLQKYKKWYEKKEQELKKRELEKKEKEKKKLKKETLISKIKKTLI